MLLKGVIIKLAAGGVAVIDLPPDQDVVGHEPFGSRSQGADARGAHGWINQKSPVEKPPGEGLEHEGVEIDIKGQTPHCKPGPMV